MQAVEPEIFISLPNVESLTPKFLIKNFLEAQKVSSLGTASIREIRTLIDLIEAKTNYKFIRFEMGVPSTPAPPLMLEAEVKALLDDQVASIYAPVEGIASLKKSGVKFAKQFLNLAYTSDTVLPTVGSINGAYLASLIALKREQQRDQFLFLDPGFSVHKQMIRMLGATEVSLDIYNYRGENLKNRLTQLFKSGRVSALLFSNPNNPTWLCLTQDELKFIGELATEYGVIVIEDLAYFGMDFRNKHRVVPSVANYTKNVITLISTSKLFSYAGQRIGLMLVNENLAKSHFDDLSKTFPTTQFMQSLTSAIYTTTAGPSHSAQVALAKILEAAVEGSYPLTTAVARVPSICRKVKALFLKNGFTIPYAKDLSEDGLIGDGYYFTLAYPNFTGEKLVKELFYFGISTISLAQTGALKNEAVRISLALIKESDLAELEKRLTFFTDTHPLPLTL